MDDTVFSGGNRTGLGYNGGSGAKNNVEFGFVVKDSDVVADHCESRG